MKLILESDGSVSRSSMVEFVEKAKLVCKMYSVKHLEYIIHLKLSGGVQADARIGKSGY